MVITTSINTFISRAGGKIEIPKLSNDLIMGIIKLADGGKTTHQRKMLPVLQSIKQTGGWNNWHKKYDEEQELWETPPMEWLVEPWNDGCYTLGQWSRGISWEDVLETQPFWLHELLDAEDVYYQ